MSIKSVFIAWSNNSRRVETLAAELGGQACFLYEVRLKGRWLTPLRYLVQSWKTWRLLEQERPEAVIVQAPPLFAPMIVATWCGLRRPAGHRVPYALDCHPATWYHRKWRWAKPLMHLLARGAAITLCTNEGAQDLLHIWKVRGFFLSDGIPTLSPPSGTIGSEGETRVGVIGSLDPDEPVAEIFAAARLLPQVTFYVTGDQNKLSTKLLIQKPENVILTGFLRNGAYTALLKNVQGLVILTNESKALNCAAYEAVAMAKPAVVSDWLEMRHSFSRGFIYVMNIPSAIAEGIKKMLDEQSTLVPEVITLRSELEKRRRPKFEEFVALLR